MGRFFRCHAFISITETSKPSLQSSHRHWHFDVWNAIAHYHGTLARETTWNDFFARQLKVYVLGRANSFGLPRCFCSWSRPGSILGTYLLAKSDTLSNLVQPSECFLETLHGAVGSMSGRRLKAPTPSSNNGGSCRACPYSPATAPLAHQPSTQIDCTHAAEADAQEPTPRTHESSPWSSETTTQGAQSVVQESAARWIAGQASAGPATNRAR